MNIGYIDNIDFINFKAEKYWSFPKSYKGNSKQESKDMVLSGNYVGSQKMDGAYYRFVKDDEGHCHLIARSPSVDGTMTNKYEWVPQLHNFFDLLPNGTCLLGEIYFPEKQGSRYVTTIMGCLLDKAIQRQNKQDKLHYYIFDVYAWNGEVIYKKYTAEQRVALLNKIAAEKWKTSSMEYVEFAKYYIGKALWDELSRVREIDGEGIVITRRNSFVEPGKRTAKKTLKIKKEIDEPIDAFLTGEWKPATRYYKGDYIENWQYWENDKTNQLFYGNYYRESLIRGVLKPVTKAYYNGWASAIEVGLIDKNNKIHSLGWISGITEEVRKGIVEDNESWKHKVVKINAMNIEPDTKKLRHGKILEWRTDKNWTDCEYEQL